MTSEGIDRQRERWWRHVANWMWLAPITWWMLGGTYYAVTKDTASVLSLIFVPWWGLLAGILGYVLVLLHARWGIVPVLALLMVGGLAGSVAWSFAGIYAALSCGLVTPLIVGGGLLRIPPTSPGGLPVRILAVVLGVMDPLLIITAMIAITLLAIHLSWTQLPAKWLWYVLASGSLIILGCSWWLRRSWSRARGKNPESTAAEAAI